VLSTLVCPSRSFQGYVVATAQLVVDGEVEQRQIAHPAFNLELGSD
jgi:hypothetical protein